MQKRTEGQFTGVGSAKLYYQNWQTDDAVATLVMTHGMGEHSDAYIHLANGLEKFKINVSAWDLRGHGKSDGKRGYVNKFEDYVQDLGFFLQHLETQKKLAKPYFIAGHSMGGLIALKYILENGSGKAKGICLSSPLLGFSLIIPPVKDFASRILNKFLPEVTLHNEIKFEDLSRDKAIVKSYFSDPFRHDKISSGVYLGMVETMGIIHARGGNAVSAPFLLQVAGNDKIVSRSASEAFFKTVYSPQKEEIIYEDAYHAIFNDTIREQVYADLSKFVLKTVAGKK